MTLAALAAAWWILVVVVLTGSAILALLQPRRARTGTRDPGPRSVSILVPLKHPADGLDAATASIFGQIYPDFDVTFSAVEEKSPALDIVQRVVREIGGTRAVRFLRTSVDASANPKVANLVEPVSASNGELILFKDAATQMEPGVLPAMVDALRPGIGLVVAIPIGRDPRTFAAGIDAALMNGYGGRLLCAVSVLGFGVGIGAAMLVRRVDLNRSDGLAAMGRSIADDHALSRAMARIGLRTTACGPTVDQALGSRSVGFVWRRHLRWASCRRTEAPLAFAVEPWVGAAAACPAAALAAPVAGVSPAAAMAVTILLWIIVEGALSLAKGWPFSWQTPAAILCREAALPFLWLAALLSRTSR